MFLQIVNLASDLVCKTAKELRDVDEVSKALKPTLASKQVGAYTFCVNITFMVLSSIFLWIGLHLAN